MVRNIAGSGEAGSGRRISYFVSRYSISDIIPAFFHLSESFRPGGGFYLHKLFSWLGLGLYLHVSTQTFRGRS